ncbi:hypothetical protein B9T64_16055 [Bacillus halotolerans]|nr:hypothetical protein B9T64_16055 [Bacillus halotolerans]
MKKQPAISGCFFMRKNGGYQRFYEKSENKVIDLLFICLTIKQKDKLKGEDMQPHDFKALSNELFTQMTGGFVHEPYKKST